MIDFSCMEQISREAAGPLFDFFLKPRHFFSDNIVHWEWCQIHDVFNIWALTPLDKHYRGRDKGEDISIPQEMVKWISFDPHYGYGRKYIIASLLRNPLTESVLKYVRSPYPEDDGFGLNTFKTCNCQSRLNHSQNTRRLIAFKSFPLTPFSWYYIDTDPMTEILMPSKNAHLPMTSAHEDGEVLARKLEKVFPQLFRARTECPEWVGGCHAFLLTENIWTVIIHLNDHHNWTRDAIADWLEEFAESRGIDISFPVPEVIPPEPGEIAMRS